MTMIEAADLTPVQRARMYLAAKQVASGAKQFDLQCGHCHSTSLEMDYGVFSCVACGRPTRVESAHRVRRQQIRAFIAAGVDLPTQGRGADAN